MVEAAPLPAAPLLAAPLLAAPLLAGPLAGAPELLEAAPPDELDGVLDGLAWPGELEQAAKTIADAATRAVSDTARVLLMGFLSECLRTRQRRPPSTGAGKRARSHQLCV